MSAFNEEPSIGKVINKIHSVMTHTRCAYQIQVIDDYSTDNTRQVALTARAKVYSNMGEKGLIYSFREEVKYFLLSDANFFIHTDADDQYDPISIPSMLKLINDGYDLVLGSRFIGEIEYMPRMKRLGNIAFSKLISLLTGIKISDSTTGFRAFNRRLASKINLINTFTYTQEQIIKAAYLNFRIIEIPVKSMVTRSSHLFNSPLEYALKAFINLFRVYIDLFWSKKK